MPRIDLNSTSLHAVTYQDPCAVLELEFRSGAIYHYFGIPAQTFEELLRAQSKGGTSIPTSGIVSPTPRSILPG
jgi:hypothetical protein